MVRIMFIGLALLVIPGGLYPLGNHPPGPYALTELVCEEFMLEVWEIKALQACHGTGYKMQYVDGVLHFLRDNEWCRYELPAGWHWPDGFK